MKRQKGKQEINVTIFHESREVTLTHQGTILTNYEVI